MAKLRWQYLGIPFAMVGALALTAAATPGNNISSHDTVTPGRCLNGATAFHPASFPKTPRINNPWLPMVPGTQFVLDGYTNDGHGRQPHEEIFIVTDLVKVINGVTTTVVWDRDFENGRLAEAELAFFAQDLDGNVWTLGEYPAQYNQHENFQDAADTWISGIRDAHGGINMRADPLTSSGWYLQGSVPSIEFLDCSRVVDTDAKACVRTGCYNHVLVTYETSPLERDGGLQSKYNARGVGLVKVGAIGGTEQESLQLVEHRRLTAKETSAARASVLALEKHAYRTNEIYQTTPPAR